MKVSPLLLALSLLVTVAPLPAQPAAVAVVAEEKPEGAIVGQPIQRDDGRWFGLTMEGPKLQLNFYDAQKHPEPADRIRAVLRIDPLTRSVERDVMNPTVDGSALVSNKPVRAPWIFKVFITLIDADDNAVETLVVNFNRAEADAATEAAEKARVAAEAEAAAAAKAPQS